MQQKSPLPRARRQGAVVVVVSSAVLLAAILISLAAMVRSARPTYETITEPYVSASGEGWRKVGVTGDAAAFEVSSETWYAATEDSVLASTDSGRTRKSVAQ